MSYSPERQQRRGRRGSGFSGMKIRLIIGVAIALFSLASYMMKTAPNPITGENQRVGGLTPDDEIQMGLSAVQRMAYQHGGPSDDVRGTEEVKMMGQRLVSYLNQYLERQGHQNPYRFQFHLLDDQRTVNAFALPGGQVFITEALYYQFSRDNLDAHEGQLAAVLGHEIGHVLERHGAQRMAKGSFMNGLVGAAGVASGSQGGAQAAAAIGNMINMKYGREDELESDKWGVLLMVMVGFHPDHMLEVMDILEKSAGAGGQPEFLSTHPLPANRKEHIQRIVSSKFPNGLPPQLR